MWFAKFSLLILSLLIVQLVAPACAQSFRCPDICRPESQGGFGIALRECRGLNSANGTELCAVRNCTTVDADGAVEQGFKCGCKNCPDICETKMTSIKSLMKKCKMSPYKNDCATIPCTDIKGSPGVECGCPKKYQFCPSICRLGNIGTLLAKLECATKPVCGPNNILCKVQPCRLGKKKGKMCGCPAQNCPNSCYTDPNLMPIAAEECKVPHVCQVAGDCKLRMCLNNGEFGRGCSCEDPKPCPKICHTDKNAKETAFAECNSNIICPTSNKPCGVKECRENDRPGYICDCTISPPPTPSSSVSSTPSPSASASPRSTIASLCPNICRNSLNATAIAEQECMIPRLCKSEGNCQVRKCVTIGKFGTSCSCSDPQDCPNVCHSKSNALELASQECDGNRYCQSSHLPCKVAKCTDGGIEGYMCRCPKFTAASPCPNVCYIDKAVADRECSVTRSCPKFDETCTVKNCEVNSEILGYACTCESASEPCSGICRVGAEAEVSRQECDRKPYCTKTGASCTLQSCSSTGDDGVLVRGLKCACSISLASPISF